MKFKMILAVIAVLVAASPTSVLSRNNEGRSGEIAKKIARIFYVKTMNGEELTITEGYKNKKLGS